MDIYKIVKEQLDKYDAYSLLAEGCPIDEFCEEAKLISNKITSNTSIAELAEIIASVYRNRFNDNTFTAKKFLPYAENIIKKLEDSMTNLNNETISNIIERRSIRKYKQTKIDDEILEKICSAGTYAPTGMNRQEPTIVLVKNKEIIKELSKLNAKYLWSGHPEHTDPFYGAPYIAIVFSNKNTSTYIQDGSLVMGNMMNAAHSLGIGSCWINRAKEMFEDELGKKYLKQWNLTDDDIGIGICILGYPDEPKTVAPPRKKDYIKIIN